MWHDQGKWVTCRKFQFLFSYTHFLQLQNASFWCKPYYKWISGYRVYEGFVNAKNNIKQKGDLNTVFANISKTASPTSDSFLLIMSQMSNFVSSLACDGLQMLVVCAAMLIMTTIHHTVPYTVPTCKGSLDRNPGPAGRVSLCQSQLFPLPFNYLFCG